MYEDLTRGYFYVTAGYDCIISAQNSVNEIKNNRGAYIHFTQDEVIFYDNGVTLLAIPRDLKSNSNIYLGCDAFCEYLGLNLNIAKDELRYLVDTCFGE